jgi:DNA-binding helix-hairpin-helix protein with protein kinase domain
MTGRTLFDHLGRRVVLGQRLDSGAEGTLFCVANDTESVAKLYDKKPIPPEQEPKLRAMIGMPLKELHNVAAWPTATLYERPGGPFHGFLMPKLKDFKEIHVLYSPANRKVAFPYADWRYLIHTAMNVAAAMDTVHSAGAVIGDVSQRNVFVLARGLVALVDCDSFQVTVNGRCFHCGVGTLEFTPPELQGRNLRGVERTPNHDHFGLAVLAFLLLFMNRHPFAGHYLGAREITIEQAIAENRFAYGCSAPSYQMRAPVGAPPMTIVPPALTDLFERAFAPTSGQANSRPTAREWAAALRALLGTLRECTADRGHVYSPHLSSCPWCALIARGAPNFFISVAYSRGGALHGGVSFVLAAVWARIEQVPKPNVGYVRPLTPPAGIPTPWPAGLGRVVTPMPLPPAILRFSPGATDLGAGLPPMPVAPRILTSPPEPPEFSVGVAMRQMQSVKRDSAQVTAGFSAIGGGLLFLLVLLTGGMVALSGSAGTGRVLALFSIAPFAIFFCFGLVWLFRESRRGELQRQLNREYEAEVLTLRLEIQQKRESWKLNLTQRQTVARDKYKQEMARWRKEIESLQAGARLRYDQEVANWRSVVDPIKAEAERRRNSASRALKRAADAEQVWDATATKFLRDFEEKKQSLGMLRERHLELGRQYVTERQQLQASAKHEQFVQFLDQALISDHEIPGIGPARTATLSFYSIETALDIGEKRILAVPGFGPKFTKRLVEWRREIESKFVFNAAAGIPPQRQQALDSKFAQPRQQIEMALLSGERDLKTISTTAENELRQHYETVKSCLVEVARANADLAVVPKGI